MKIMGTIAVVKATLRRREFAVKARPAVMYDGETAALTERQEAELMVRFLGSLMVWIKRVHERVGSGFGDKVREVGWILTQTINLTKPAEADFDPTNLLMQSVSKMEPSSLRGQYHRCWCFK